MMRWRGGGDDHDHNQPPGHKNGQPDTPCICEGFSFVYFRGVDNNDKGGEQGMTIVVG